MNSTEPQTPSGDGIFLDHVGWFVPDMEAAARAFDRLGFPMTPFTVHTNEQPDGGRVPSGTANRCAMIRRGYLEVLVRMPGLDTELTRQMDAGLARYAGLHLIAFTVADADAAAARLRAAGFDPQPPIALRRPMPLDDGGEGTAAFSVIRLPAGAMAEGRIQVLTQDTPDVVWQPSVIATDNALDMLSGVLICAADPDEAAERYARFTGGKARGSRGFKSIALDRGEIAICDPATLARLLSGIAPPDLPYIAAVAIRSADLERTRDFLGTRDIAPLSDIDGRLVVPPDFGAGAAFVFHAADTSPFGMAAGPE